MERKANNMHPDETTTQPQSASEPEMCTGEMAGDDNGYAACRLCGARKHWSDVDASPHIKASQPASAPDNDAPQDEPRQLQPGESMIHIDDDGMTLTSIVPIQPQVATFRANRDFMRAIVNDWLSNHDEEFWDVLVKARVEKLREKKRHLALVTDPATVASIGKSRNRKS